MERLTGGFWRQLPEHPFLRVQGRNHPLPVVGVLKSADAKTGKDKATGQK